MNLQLDSNAPINRLVSALAELNGLQQELMVVLDGACEGTCQLIENLSQMLEESNQTAGLREAGE